MDIKLDLLPVKMRLPLKFGAETIDSIQIAHVELVSGTLANKLEIVRPGGYGSEDTFAIQWKDGTPASVKSGTVKINIYLEGNDPARKIPNATVSLKVNIQ